MKSDGPYAKAGGAPALAGLPQIPQQPGGMTMPDAPNGRVTVPMHLEAITPMQGNQQLALPDAGSGALGMSTDVPMPKKLSDDFSVGQGSQNNNGLRARYGDSHHQESYDHHDVDIAVDEREFGFFNDLTRQFVRGAIIGGDCQLVSLKTGQHKLAIYQVDKNLENFFLIDQESGKSDLWGLAGIEVRPAPNKWSLSLKTPEELAKMVLVKYTSPEMHPVTPLVVVALKTKSERDIFYAGMKILRLYAGHKTPRGGASPKAAAPPPPSKQMTIMDKKEPPPDHVPGNVPNAHH